MIINKFVCCGSYLGDTYLPIRDRRYPVFMNYAGFMTSLSYRIGARILTICGFQQIPEFRRLLI